MKRKSGIIVIVIVAVLVACTMSAISAYNGLINSDEGVSKAYSDIQADLQRRNDLIPNLVATVQAYASHEEEVFSEIAQARSALMSSTNMQQTAEADAAMSSALSRLLAITEAYPDLKANQGFIDLQTQLEGTENRIKVSRIKYNEAAKEYNTKIRRFPVSFIASAFGFEKAQYFEAQIGAQDAPKVEFK